MGIDHAERDERTLRELHAVADKWRAARSERQERTHLERNDFDAVRSAGFLEAVVPFEQGGSWRGVEASVGPISSMLRVLGAGDPSVALVSTMHPAVLAFWLAAPPSEDPDWKRQCGAVTATSMSGQRWGTITSEPGSGGDILRTKAVATPIDARLGLPGRAYSVTGTKHFGSGLGIVDWMVTTAVPEGESEPAIFALDVHDRPWDGSAGLMLADEWDGSGMAATQSHGMRLEEVPAIRFGMDLPLTELGRHTSPFILTLFSSVIVGVLDEAVAAARGRLESRRDTLRSYERVEWTQAERRYWLAEQALAGSIGAIESGEPTTALHAALRAKQSIAELAENVLLGLGRVVGGGSFSRRSPFSHWFEDVRALGFLRPPWSLADDQLFETSW